ncbi:peptidase U32 family protein, partial [Eisenbergiella porci]
MKKPELLAPAGDYTCFQAALKAGADAVYIGGQRFGARAYAGNFSDAEVVDALKEAHFYGKRLYLTVNTLLKQNEMGELEDFIGPFYEAGLDGVIVQDIGALSLLGTLFPGLELHASTQMTVTDVRGAEFLKQLGVCRVVPARELTLGEIEALCRESGMEVEAFIHGAMCYCYSGQCLFSSLLGGRSGNRGRCAQPCRQPYRILPGQNGQECYPLSLKDMCTIEFIPELIKAGIDSFKIEGRMKKPEYVAGVTSVYRRRIDACLDSPDGAGKVSASDMHILSSLYIRSEISGGYYHRHNGREMITLDQPGYAGCDEAVLQNIRSGILEPELTVPVILEASLHPGRPLRLKAALAGKDIPAAVSVEGQEVQTASKRPLSREDVEKQLRRTGGSGFRAEDIRLDMADNAFLPVKALNEARRQVLDLLKQKTAQENGPVRTANKCRTDAPATAKGIPSCAAAVSENTQKGSRIPHGPLSVHASVKTIFQAYSCLKEGADRLYLPHTFLRGDWEAALKDMKNEFPGAELYLSLPVILRKQDEARLERLSAALGTGLFDGVQAASLSGRQWLYEKD